MMEEVCCLTSVEVQAAPDGAIARLLIDRKRAESMLRMLEGNTEPADILKLRNEWLVPVLEQIAELQVGETMQSG